MLGLRSSYDITTRTKCIYCAFAARKHLLESQRLKASTCHLSLARPPFGHRLLSGKRSIDLSRVGDKKRRDHGYAQNARQPFGRPLVNSSPSAGDHHTERNTIRPGKRSIELWNTNRHDRPSHTRISIYGTAEKDRSRKSKLEPRVKAGPSRDTTKDEFGTRIGRLAAFDDALRNELQEAQTELSESAVVENIARERDENVRDFFSRTWRTFVSTVRGAVQDEVVHESSTFGGLWQPDVYADLKAAYQEGGNKTLKHRVRYAYVDGIIMPRFDKRIIKNQEKLVDLRYPGEWYPRTRAVRRQFHLHVGPTNSGKTYQALKRLESVTEGGVYAGPLRLLAHEVFTRMNAKGVPCHLATGEEKRRPTIDHEQASKNLVTSCTVEMLPLNTMMQVAVIDEIQMISDPNRGWAWTQAVLGVCAKEVHLCGEERAVPLIQEICAALGEELIVHKYERLSPLRTERRSLQGDLSKLRPGDCIVSFSVMGIHALKKQIEERTGKRVAVVYGALPAETRAQQAQLFNDPNSGYDYLVASDAIGMGLNLAIKRVVFETVAKHNGASYNILDVAPLKQIAGRAGRYRVAQQASSVSTAQQSIGAAKGEANPSQSEQPENVGLVTTLEDYDLHIVERALATDPPPLLNAGLVPTGFMLERFASYFPPETPFSYILQKMWHISSYLKNYYFICGLKDLLWVADIIEPVKGLTLRERYAFSAIPAGGRKNVLWDALLPAFARIIAEQKGGDLTDIKELPLEILDRKMDQVQKSYLRDLEGLHQALICYMWLSFRFAGLFPHRALAKHATELTEAKIAEVLGSFNFSEQSRVALAAARNARLLQAEAQREAEAAAAASAAIAAAVKQTTPDETPETDRVTLAAESDSDDIGLEEFEDAEQLTTDDNDSGVDFLESSSVGDSLGERGSDKQDIVKQEHDIAGHHSSSFVTWREQQTPGENQASGEEDDVEIRPSAVSSQPRVHTFKSSSDEGVPDTEVRHHVSPDIPPADGTESSSRSSSANV